MNKLNMLTLVKRAKKKKNAECNSNFQGSPSVDMLCFRREPQSVTDLHLTRKTFCLILFIQVSQNKTKTTYIF